MAIREAITVSLAPFTLIIQRTNRLRIDAQNPRASQLSVEPVEKANEASVMGIFIELFEGKHMGKT